MTTATKQPKKSVGLITKKTTMHVQHTFMYISLPLFCIYRRNAQVLEMQNFTLAYMKGWMYIQTYGRFTSNTYPSLEPKFL